MRGKILPRKKQWQSTSILLVLVISLIANSYHVGNQSTGLNEYLNASYNGSGELASAVTALLHQPTNSTHQYVNSQIPGGSNPLQPEYFIDSPPYIERYGGPFLTRALDYDSLNDRLFFDSGKGIGVFYPENDSFIQYPFTAKNYFPLEHGFSHMVLNTDTTKLYVATYAGLYSVTTADFSFEKFNTSDGLAHNFVRSLALDEATNRLFISTDGGLSIFYTNNKTFADTSNLPYYLTFGGVGNFVFNPKTKELYTTGWSGTMYSYNTSSNILSELVHFTRTADSLFLDNESQLLYIGNPGIVIFNCTSRTVIANYDESYDPAIESIREAIVFEPSYGGMIFVNADGNGLVIVNSTSGEVSIIRREHGLLSNDVGSLVIITNASTAEPLLAIGVRGAVVLYDIKLGEISKTVVFDRGLLSGRIWELDLEKTTGQIFIGEYECLSIFNISSKQFTNYDYVYGLPRAPVTATILDSTNNRLFVGTTSGLSIFDLTLEQVVKVYGETEGLADDAIYSLAFFEPQNKLFIGTYNGLSVLDLATDQVKNYLSVGWCDMFVLDESSNRLFIAGSGNIYIYDLQTEIVEPIIFSGENSIGGIYSIQFYPEKQILFAGTVSGLYVLDLQQKTILKHFTGENSGLTDNLIDGGLSFDPATETLFIGNLGIVLYDFAHDFWINTNDAYLEDEGLYRPYVNDLVYYNNILYLALPHGGFFTLSLNDTDGDGIFDCYEDWLFGTDLNLYDTDGDGFSDGEELWRGKDPLNPYSYPNDWLCWFVRVLIPLVAVLGGIIAVIAFNNYITKKKEKRSDSSQAE